MHYRREILWQKGLVFKNRTQFGNKIKLLLLDISQWQTCYVFSTSNLILDSLEGIGWFADGIFHGSIFSYDAKNTRDQGKLLM